MVFVVVALVGVVDVLAGVVLVPVALVDVVDVSRLVPVVFVLVALVHIVDMFTGVVFVLVAFMGVVLRSNHYRHLRKIDTLRWLWE